MRIALQTALQGVQDGETPFGACLVDTNGTILSAACNNVTSKSDPTAHAEIQAIREGARIRVSRDLKDCIMYATCEPCSMCLSACLWADLTRIVYAARNEDSARFGIDCIPISCSQMRELSKRDLKIVGDVLREESLRLFSDWQSAAVTSLKKPHF